jgi:hypothetical protein
MTRYEIILYWSAEDEAFIAEVPELAGCMADGATRQEALANAEVVIAEAPFNSEIAEAMRTAFRAEVPDMPDRIVAATGIYSACR